MRPACRLLRYDDDSGYHLYALRVEARAVVQVGADAQRTRLLERASSDSQGFLDGLPDD